jgi:hypothetical protein
VLTRLRPAVFAVSALVLAAGISGCAKFDKALGQQWIVVTLAPNTSVATAKRVALACSHVPNMPLMGKVAPDTGEAGVVDQVDYDATNATDAEIALLQECLGKYPSVVQGFTETDDGEN